MKTPVQESESGNAPPIEMVDLTVGAFDTSETVVLDEVTWTIGRDDFWVVAGLPGSGKSDLLATAAGLNRPLSGTLRFFGGDTEKLTEPAMLQERLRVGLVFEGGGRLLHHLTLYENIALPLCYHRNRTLQEARGRVRDLLEFVGLAELAHHTPGRIKPSWRQRAALARALAMTPEVLLLDNPLAGLDPSEMRWWRETVVALSAGHEIGGGRPVSLVVTCHDLRPWVDLGKRFAYLHLKRWHVAGGPGELAGCDAPVVQELLATEFKRN